MSAAYTYYLAPIFPGDEGLGGLSRSPGTGSPIEQRIEPGMVCLVYTADVVQVGLLDSAENSAPSDWTPQTREQAVTWHEANCSADPGFCELA